MINVNDLVYCRNSGLQVLTINSHTLTPPFLCLLGWGFFWFFFSLTSLFVSSSMGFFTYKEGLEGIYFSKNIFFSFITCYFILDVLVHFYFFFPEFHAFLLWYAWLLLVHVRCV